VGQLTAGGNELLQAALEGRRQFASAADFLAALNSFAALQSASVARANASVAAPGARATLAPDQSAVTQQAYLRFRLPNRLPLHRLPPLHSLIILRLRRSRSPRQSHSSWSARCCMLVMLVVAIVGIAVAPWGRNLLGMHQHKPTPAPATPIPSVNQRDLDDAFREARMAEDAAEKLSEMLSRFDINRRLIKLNEGATHSPTPKRSRRTTWPSRPSKGKFIDSEGAFLLHTKRFQTYTPEVQALAFNRLDQQVASVGVNWRTRVAELLRRQIPK
jgi:hypothetical protein